MKLPFLRHRGREHCPRPPKILLNRVAGRFMIGTLTSFIASILVWSGVMHWRAYSALEASWLPTTEQLFIQLLESGIADGTRKWQADSIAEHLSLVLEQPVRALKIDDPSIPSAYQAKLREGKSTVLFGKRAAHTYFITAARDDQVFAIGPIQPKGFLTIPQLVFFILSIFAIIASTGFFIAYPTLRQINELGRAAERIIEGDLSARVATPANASDALARYAVVFNRMAEHNQQLLEHQRQFFQAISHELRTPTARMRFGLEMLECATTEEERDERLKAIDEDLTEIDGFVGELVAFNRIDHDPNELHLASVSVLPLLKTEKESLHHLRTDFLVEIACPEDLRVMADPRLFRRVLRNLIANAMRYAKSRVRLQCELQGEFVKLDFDDDGPGIPPEERIRVLDPFVRLEKSRGKGSGGIGLGLTIVQRIVQLHEASLTIAESSLGGARFTLLWRQGTADEEGDLKTVGT